LEVKETGKDVLKDQNFGFSSKSLETIKNGVQGICELLKKVSN